MRLVQGRCRGFLTIIGIVKPLDHVTFRDIHPSSRQGVDSLIGKVFEFEEHLYIVHLADCRGGMTGVLRVVEWQWRSACIGKVGQGNPRDEVGLAATSNFSLPLDTVVVLRRLIKINTPMVIKEYPMTPQTTPPAVAPAWLDFFLTVPAEAGAPVAEGAAVESGAPELWAASAAAGPKHWEHKNLIRTLQCTDKVRTVGLERVGMSPPTKGHRSLVALFRALTRLAIRARE
ncbi:hypothetical protein BU17DRAFT_69880 [Hysterangium stoloniferum]|nr:hypothetical protein BU17DRAFT_69880 [Hysterangium stoloniferum]